MVNFRDPRNVAKVYTEDTIWRNRDRFLTGTAEVEAFLTEKWNKEKEYVLRKELFAFGDNKIAVQFWYEYRDAYDGMKWKRSVHHRNLIPVDAALLIIECMQLLRSRRLDVR